MQSRKIITFALIGSLLASPLALAGPPNGPGPDHHSGPGPRHHLGSDAVEVLIGGLTLWMVGSTYYQWQQDQKVYVPVEVDTSRAARPGIDSGPYYERVPNGSDAVLINGTQYFTYKGEFYLPVQRDGRVVYVKVQL